MWDNFEKLDRVTINTAHFDLETHFLKDFTHVSSLNHLICPILERVTKMGGGANRGGGGGGRGHFCCRGHQQAPLVSS